MSTNTARPGASRGFAKNFKTPTVVGKPKDVSAYNREVVDADGDVSDGPVTPLAVVKPLRTGDMPILHLAYKNPVTTPNTDPAKILIGGKANKDRCSWGGAVHDPNAEGAVVMPRPPEEWARKQ